MNEISKQFEAMKAKHPDAIMIFRRGSEYTCIKEDASVAAKVMGLPVCPQFDVSGEMFLSVSFNYNMLDRYLPMLVRAGNRVAICEPLEKVV